MPLRDFTATNLARQAVQPASISTSVEEPQRAAPHEEEAATEQIPTASAPPVVEAAPVRELTARGVELAEALKNRIFDIDCNEIRIIADGAGEGNRYRALISIGTRYYDATGELLPNGASEDDIRDLIALFLLPNMSSSALEGSNAEVVTRGTFFLEEGVEKRSARVQVFYPPVTHKPSFNMQLVSKQSRDLGALIEEGAVGIDIGYFLGAAVAAGANIIFSGPPGAGKTTLLNACTQEIPNENPVTGDSTGHDMVIAIQDSDELNLAHLSFVQEFFSFEDAARALNMRAEGTMSDLIEITKVSRADRIILGECRGREAFDFLEAASIFKGNMTTLHASSAIQALSNIVVYALRHPDAQLSGPRVVQQMVAGGIDLVVQVDRVADRRIATQIVALDGTVTEDGTPRRITLWNYDQSVGDWVKPSDNAGVPDRLVNLLTQNGFPDYWRHPELVGT